jgi:ATP-dependent RNA helicase RhlE
MYEKRRSTSRRYGKTSSNNRSKNYGSRYGGGAKGYGSSRGYGGNRRKFGQYIAHSMYVSKPTHTEVAAVYTPQNSFADFKLHPVLAKNISDRQYVTPTKIQDQTIPEILQGRDLLGIASTGSGKTGAFLIPMIDKALRNQQSKVLIITPTRELASQINNEFRKFARNTRLRMALVIGGESIQNQIRFLRSNPQFVVATPGRLLDLVERKRIHLNSFNNVVLDEVDQMLDMGFIDDIRLVISRLAPQRQSLFFSATLARKEEGLANSLLKNPLKVESYKQSPLKTIHQDIVKVSSKDKKVQVLHDLLIKEEFNKVLVFSRTKRGADKISNELSARGIRVDALHGDKSQNKRSRILKNFRYDEIDVLIATDVAARGIDIPDISHVINFDEPATYNDYIHRIGRTGRIGKKGTALTFVLGYK